MLSKLFSDVYDFVFGRRNKRPVEGAECEVLESPLKRSRTELESVVDDRVIRTSRTERFKEHSGVSMASLRPTVNGCDADDFERKSWQSLKGFSGGDHVKELSVSSYESGCLFSASSQPLQRTALRQPFGGSGKTDIADNQQDLKFGKTSLQRKSSHQQKHTMTARECIDIEGKREYQKLIEEHTTRIALASTKSDESDCGSCNRTRSSYDSRMLDASFRSKERQPSDKSNSFKFLSTSMISAGHKDLLKWRLNSSSSFLSEYASKDQFRNADESCRIVNDKSRPSSFSRALAASGTPVGVRMQLTGDAHSMHFAPDADKKSMELTSSTLPQPHDEESKNKLTANLNSFGARESGSDIDKSSSSIEFVRSPVVTEWQNAVKLSKYAKDGFLEEISRNEKTEDFQRKLRESETEVRHLKEKRSQEEEKLAKKVRHILRVSSRSAIPVSKPFYELSSESDEEVEEKSAVAEFPELSEDQAKQVNRALNPFPPNEVLVEGFKLQITRRDMLTLSGLNWLNDEVINFYMNLLMERGSRDDYPRVYSFNTFFYPKLKSGGHSSVKRWTKQVDLFSYDIILIPVHLGVHWCLAVVDFQRKQIRYYDSMGSHNEDCLHAIQKYLEQESHEKKKHFSISDWKLFSPEDIPQQMNGSDCGMFACKFAEYITRNAPITFNQSHMPYFRRRMVYEILTKRLL